LQGNKRIDDAQPAIEQDQSVSQPASTAVAAIIASEIDSP
jgi:hypothetical protein